jgi:signal transduction histidine kinase
VRNLADVCIIDIEGSDKSRRLRVTCRDPAKVHLSYETAPIAAGEIRQPLLVEDATQTERDLFSVLDIDSPDCTSEPCSVMLVPLQAQGNYLGLLLLISLRHSRKFGTQDLHLAEAIAQRAALSMETAILYQTATQATRSRDEMLGIVAHDLRNPLQIISVDARVLRQQSSEAASEIGAEIGKAAMRMNRLIQDLLDITRIETGHLALRQEWISIADLVREVIDTQETLASSAAVNIQSSVPADSPKIWADRDRLNQIFENLIGNAIKFSRPGGLITLGVKAENAEIVFSIADTGAGIAPSDLDHVFDRFWQAHKTKRSGAGLGLAIVKGLVQAHGGRVWVQSTLDKGSTFFFAMPTAASEHQSLTDLPTPSSPVVRPRLVEEAA